MLSNKNRLISVVSVYKVPLSSDFKPSDSYEQNWIYRCKCKCKLNQQILLVIHGEGLKLEL